MTDSREAYPRKSNTMSGMQAKVRQDVDCQQEHEDGPHLATEEGPGPVAHE
ncbi:hypothetical protein [Haloarchaeobius litoreus]|uniref:Uncharacterized protein n=1 Tax=Haloarchaeobius litoreus TaxID=755306 RepID=A0ABD6DIE6_9EURY|nr:hypothetical protein [Haloarchaeobius litoreus]